MHSVKEKVSNAAAAGKEKVDIMQAKAEEKAEKAVARTKEEKVIAEERRKAKEAEAKMKLHETKAENAADKLKHSHHIYGHHDPLVGGQEHHAPVGTAANPTTGVSTPTYPLGRHPPGHHKYI
ncbi:hypothetical protein ACH5RR_038963 [Cinchona calisaya]|uniref:Late embryogenesis abundant protein n=1 Tax=Cinchona calisaya TaxID=153742 RepID=A0ABD2Y265_9GENT